jgi:PAS domain S-box-containing protein
MLFKLTGNEQIELMRAIAQNSDDCIYAKDLDGRITFANPATLAVFGKSLSEVLGRAMDEVCPDQAAAQRVMQTDRLVLQKGLPVEVEELVAMADGTPRWWSARKTPFRDAGGRIIGLLGISRDITERKRHEAEREALARQWHLALDAAGLGWWRYDLRTRTLDYDPRTGEVFGLAGRRATGEEFMRLIHPDDVVNVRDSVRNAMSARPMASYTVQFRVRRPDDGERWVESHGMPLTEPGEERASSLIGTIADITPRKQIEDALRESNERLKDADRQKDEFMATLAHELRNPLAPLKTIVELLKARDDDPLVHRVRPVIDRQISHLARLVDDLLDISRIARGAIHLQEQALDLGAVARTSAEPLRAAMAAANVRFDLHVEAPAPRVVGDETRLAQCITNLLSNALKFTPADGLVSLSVRHEGALAVIEVRDTGIGIAPESLERIFRLFVQERPSAVHGMSGLGIGLALTRKLVELHGGSIRAYSQGPGLGSKFRIELPLAVEIAQPAQPVRTPVASDGRGVSVLVVDDNVDAADSLREMLAMGGYRAASAYTGQAALDLIASDKPDVALLDIGLPDIDGYEVCRRIRARTRAHQPALVALTGWGQDRDKERATAAGFNAHLTKPADTATLLAMLRELASAARREPG